MTAVQSSSDFSKTELSARRCKKWQLCCTYTGVPAAVALHHTMSSTNPFSSDSECGDAAVSSPATWRDPARLPGLPPHFTLPGSSTEEEEEDGEAGRGRLISRKQRGRAGATRGDKAPRINIEKLNVFSKN